MSRRSIFLVLNTAVVLLSLLTGLRIVPGPDTAGMALAFYSIPNDQILKRLSENQLLRG